MLCQADVVARQLVILAGDSLSKRESIDLDLEATEGKVDEV